MSKLNPKNGFVVLKPIEEQEQTYGNIVIPDLGKERPEMGEVIATSQTYNWHRGEFVDSQLSVGQKVLIPKMGTAKISVAGEDYFITKDTEVLAVVEN
jgi:chaperonin GroES